MLPRIVAAVALASGLAVPVASALTIGQIDTFQSDNGGWFAGGGPFGQVPPVPPQRIATGGPTGANDAFLQVTASGGAGPGSRLVAMNASQWAGDYLAGGFATIEMDLINFGPSDLSIRLLFEDPGAGAPENIAITNSVASLTAGGGWAHFVFQIDVAAFTPLLGDVSDLLAGTTLIRIVHAATAAFPGEPITGTLGIDNISAGFVPRPGPFPNAVPEPASTGLVLVALALFAVVRRRRMRS